MFVWLSHLISNQWEWLEDEKCWLHFEIWNTLYYNLWLLWELNWWNQQNSKLYMWSGPFKLWEYER